MQSVLIPVPAADPLVDRFRLEGDWSRRVGVPAHITLAGPFPLSQELPRERLAAVARAAAGRHFRLSEVGAVRDSTCLLVADEKPLEALRSKLLETVGGGQLVSAALPFHLTISRGDSPGAEAVIRRTLEPRLPLECEIGDLAVAALSADRLTLIAIDGHG